MNHRTGTARECHICSVVQFFSPTSVQRPAESPAQGTGRTAKQGLLGVDPCSKQTHLLGNAYVKVFRAVSAKRAWKRAPAADQRFAMRAPSRGPLVETSCDAASPSIAKRFVPPALAACAGRRFGRWYDMVPSVDGPSTGKARARRPRAWRADVKRRPRGRRSSFLFEGSAVGRRRCGRGHTGPRSRVQTPRRPVRAEVSKRFAPPTRSR